MQSANNDAARDASRACWETANAVRTVSSRKAVAWQTGVLSQAAQSQSLLRCGEEVVPVLCQSIDWSCNAIEPIVTQYSNGFRLWTRMLCVCETSV